SGLEGSREDAAALGALLGFLEAAGFKEEAPFGVSWNGFSSATRPPWLSRVDALRLEAWRRWEGLRRSIDFGTRWTVFEVHHPLLWGRVEREVKAFLYRLQRLGFLSSGLANDSGESEPPGFRVECGPSEGSERDGPGSDERDGFPAFSPLD